MLHAEFMGLPGSGKSSIRQRLINALKQKGEKYLTMEEALLISLRRKFDDRIYRYILKIIPDLCAIKIITSIFNKSRCKFLAQNRFLAGNDKAFWAFLKSRQFNCISSWERTLLISWFLETASIYQVISEQIDKDAMVIFDEGFFQKSVNLFISPGHNRGIPDSESISRYLDSVPKPDILILVEADIEKCINRMDFRRKGLPLRLSRCSPDDISAFLEDCQRHFETVIDRLEKNGNRIVRILNNGSMDNAVKDLLNKIE